MACMPSAACAAWYAFARIVVCAVASVALKRSSAERLRSDDFFAPPLSRGGSSYGHQNLSAT
jgi:hypothetical protein